MTNRAKAEAFYKAAINCYKSLGNDSHVLGSYALCLIDYGQLLAERGEHGEADPVRKRA